VISSRSSNTIPEAAFLIARAPRRLLDEVFDLPA
jgi:hypothetical protein